MAYTVKRKPMKPEKPARAGSSILSKLKPDHLPIPTETVKEGAHEVTEKLKADISRIARVRRAVSLKPIVGCLDCDATGKAPCGACGGAGNQKLVWNDEIQQCATCDGTGQVTCAECMGRGTVENTNRKKLIWMLVLGGIAWAYVLFRLWGGDILPEQRAKYLTRGGGGGATGAQAPAGGVLGHPGANHIGAGRPNGAGPRGAAGQPGMPGQPPVGRPMGSGFGAQGR
jgi:hypothetical protein